MKYVVVRTYSHTDKQCLWKVLSRPLADKQSADDWRDFMQGSFQKEHPHSRKKPKFFVVAMEDAR